MIHVRDHNQKKKLCDPSFMLVLRRVFIFLSVAYCQPPPGVWVTAPYALPSWGIPDVPLGGNGNLGILYDSWGSRGHGISPIPGPSKLNSVDIWFSTNSFWSCTSCNSYSPGCCAKAALGGVSIVSPSVHLTFINMTEDMSQGKLGSFWATPNGGLFSTVSIVHPDVNIVLSTLLYTPGKGDPPSLDLNVSTWVLGASAHRARPLPGSVACFSSSAQNVSCGDPGAQVVAATRMGSPLGSIHPTWAGLATGVLLSSPTSLSLVPSSPPGGPPGCFPCRGADWGVDTAFSLTAGAPGYVLTAEAETMGSYAHASDPSPNAVALLLPYLTAAAVADIQRDVLAFWGAFYSVSSVRLPTQPLLETVWWGSQYIGATAASRRALDVAPALYGPWETADYAMWNGDYVSVAHWQR